MSMSEIKSLLTEQPLKATTATTPVVKDTVVVIDDDTSVLSTMRVLLKEHYKVEVCNNAEGGVALVSRVLPSAVILDIKMPGKDGFWAFSRIREFDPKIPIIFNSAYQDTLEAGDAVASYKPFAYLFKAGEGGLHTLHKTVAEAVHACKLARRSASS